MIYGCFPDWNHIVNDYHPTSANHGNQVRPGSTCSALLFSSIIPSTTSVLMQPRNERCMTATTLQRAPQQAKSGTVKAWLPTFTCPAGQTSGCASAFMNHTVIHGVPALKEDFLCPETDFILSHQRERFSSPEHQPIPPCQSVSECLHPKPSLGACCVPGQNISI